LNPLPNEGRQLKELKSAFDEGLWPEDVYKAEINRVMLKIGRP
jgi:hypothetical protein